MNKKGVAYLYVVFAGLILLSLIIGWFYLREQAAFGGLNLPLPFLEKSEFFETKDWKSFQTEGLTILYPPDWFLVENKYISQYPYTPGKISSDIYNAISVSLIVTQIQASYVNEDWFNMLYNAKENESVVNQFRASDTNTFVKIGSGKTLMRDRFVLFKDSKFPDQTQAYLLFSSLKIYYFTLINFDQTGLDYFKKIISTGKAI